MSRLPVNGSLPNVTVFVNDIKAKPIEAQSVLNVTCTLDCSKFSGIYLDHAKVHVEMSKYQNTGKPREPEAMVSGEKKTLLLLEPAKNIFPRKTT